MYGDVAWQHIKAPSRYAHVTFIHTVNGINHPRHADYTGLILGWRPANERRRYFATTPLIGKAQA